MVDAVRGAEELEALGRRFKAAGNGTVLRKDLLRGIRGTSKGTIKKIRTAAREELPQSGGLAAVVASSSIGVRTRLSGQSAGVRITGTSRRVRNLRALNSGLLRHPVYGNRSTWVSQRVAAGWFDKPVVEDAPEIRSGIERVMRDVARRIEG